MSKRLFSTVNQAELKKFSAIGKQWWNTSSRDGASPLHDMNPARVSFIRECLASKLMKDNQFATMQLHGLKILDVGSGGGLLSESLARLGAQVVAIDPSQENIDIATAHSRKDPKTSTIEYKRSTIEELVDQGRKFDVVTCLEVIEHVDMPLRFLTSCSECLNPGGSLFLSTINRSAMSYLMTIVAAEYILNIVPAGTHDWKKYIKPNEMKLMLESTAVNMKVDRIVGLRLSIKPISRVMEWRLSRYDTDVNYIIHAIKK